MKSFEHYTFAEDAFLYGPPTWWYITVFEYGLN